jgi:hypothetical protein
MEQQNLRGSPRERLAAARDAIFSHYDSIPYYNDVEDVGSISYITPGRSTRRVDAAFDPANAGKAKLLGAADPKLLGATALGTGAALAAPVLSNALRSPDVGAIEPEYQSYVPQGQEPNRTLMNIAEALRAGDKRLGGLSVVSPLSGMANIADKMAFKAPRTYGDWFGAMP